MSSADAAARPQPAVVKPVRRAVAPRRIDWLALLVAPAALFLLALFVYPFLYGLWLSFQSADGALGNYTKFFSDPFQYETVWTTLRLAVPVTVVNLGLAVPIALRVRLMRRQRVLTTILVVPITLGTVLVAQGLLNYLGPQGWFNRVLMEAGLIHAPVRLLHNYWGVFMSLLITGLPFTFLLTLSYVSGIDPALENAAATLGATAAARFRTVLLPLLLPGLAITFCLSFVQALSVFPSAVLLGAPSGPTRVISIAAYDAAFEQYDYALASAIAMVMGAVQLGVVVLVLLARSGLYRGASGGKG
jgi:putative spermidine/putrescine transport system permease protein